LIEESVGDNTMMSIERAELEMVAAGAAPTSTPANDNAFGRCGPGTGMSYLGDVYTPQCAAHDASVRASQARGESKVWSHLQALPLLPAAIGSYLEARA
jgi:hypothetical protein